MSRPRRGLVVRVFAGAAFASLAGLFALACGSRGPLDDTPLDAGAADVAAADVSEPSAPDAAPPPPVVIDAGHEASVLGCGTCIVEQCAPDIVACVQSPACREALQCVATTCFGGGGGAGGGGGGGLDPSCLLACSSGNSEGAFAVVEIFQCVTGECGEDCTPLLSGLLGGFGGGG